jgi:hypothetical protein
MGGLLKVHFGGFIKMTKQQYSPATQVVSDAVKQVYWDWGNLCPADAHTIAAAALRAAVDAVLPETTPLPMGSCGVDELIRETRMNARLEFLSILKELDETK